MHKKLILGLVLVLSLTLTSPLIAAEESPAQWPSFNVAEWVFGLLEIFELESSSADIGPEADPGCDPEADPNCDPKEMEPGADPNNEPTEEMGPGLEPGG